MESIFSAEDGYTHAPENSFAELSMRLAENTHAKTPYSLCVIDFDLPGLNGTKGIKQIFNLCDHQPVAILSRGGSLELGQRVFQAGASGLINKDLPADTISIGMKLVSEGHYVTLLSNLSHSQSAAQLVQLSERELQILRGLCDGLQNKEIAHTFAIQEVTVKMHMRAIVRKLGAKNRTHAAMIARDQNLV